MMLRLAADPGDEQPGQPADASAWLAVVSLLATRPGSPDALLQARAQAAFLALAAASFSIFLLRRRRLRQLRPWR